MTIELAKTFNIGKSAFDIVRYRNGAQLEYWIERTEFNQDNELELVFEQRGRASFIIKNEGGRVGGMTIGDTGWDMTVGPICTLHRGVSEFGDTLGAIEGSARILLAE